LLLQLPKESGGYKRNKHNYDKETVFIHMLGASYNMKICLLILLAILNHRPMGMDYYIEADVKTKCKNEFPSGLSFFFEQVGGFGEKSMVSQVENILNINLSTFQEYDYMDNEESDDRYWKDLKEFNALLDTLLAKIQANPRYYTKVKYNPVTPIFGFSSDPKEMARMNKTVQEYEKHPMYGYPNDHGYLSSDAFIRDIKILKSVLQCYADQGATKIKLSYD
jgi:hypothetical protein